jgi:hypothetical protein
MRLLIPSPAEGEGFEPTLAFTKPVFKTGALNHSAIPPFPDLLKFNFTWIGAGILPYLGVGCNTRTNLLRRTAILIRIQAVRLNNKIKLLYQAFTTATGSIEEVQMWMGS